MSDPNRWRFFVSGYGLDCCAGDVRETNYVPVCPENPPEIDDTCDIGCQVSSDKRRGKAVFEQPRSRVVLSRIDDRFSLPLTSRRDRAGKSVQ